MKPVNGEAHYEHEAHPGHKVSVKPVPEGFKYSSGWQHTGPSGTVANSGAGGKSLYEHLKTYFNSTPIKAATPPASAGGAPTPGFSPSVKTAKPAKPAPTFVHPAPGLST